MSVLQWVSLYVDAFTQHTGVIVAGRQETASIPVLSVSSLRKQVLLAKTPPQQSVRKGALGRLLRVIRSRDPFA